MIGLHSRTETNDKRAEHLQTSHVVRKIVVTIFKKIEIT